MNTIQLECFLSVAEHLNFSRASEELKITQPAVSHQIRSLEEELGVKLFRRTSKSVTLTSEGILFLPDANVILKTAFSARDRLKKKETLLHFEVGCHSPAELRLLPPVIRSLHREWPSLRPQLHTIPFDSLFSMVENQQLHAALSLFSGAKKTALAYRELFSCPMAFICLPDHPLAGRSALTTEMLGDYNLISSAPPPAAGGGLSVSPESHFLLRFPGTALRGRHGKHTDPDQSRPGLHPAPGYPRSQRPGALLYPRHGPASSFLWGLLPEGQ